MHHVGRLQRSLRPKDSKAEAVYHRGRATRSSWSMLMLLWRAPGDVSKGSDKDPQLCYAQSDGIEFEKWRACPGGSCILYSYMYWTGQATTPSLSDVENAH